MSGDASEDQRGETCVVKLQASIARIDQFVTIVDKQAVAADGCGSGVNGYMVGRPRSDDGCGRNRRQPPKTLVTHEAGSQPRAVELDGAGGGQGALPVLEIEVVIPQAICGERVGGRATTTLRSRAAIRRRQAQGHKRGARGSRGDRWLGADRYRGSGSRPARARLHHAVVAGVVLGQARNGQ